MRHDRYLAVVIAAFLAYSLGWSYIAVSKVLSLHATIGDLGIMMQGSWDAVHGGLRGLINTLLGQAALLLYAAFLPFGLHQAEAIVVFQSFWLGAGALPVYGVARRVLRNGPVAASIAISYLIYFPLAGVNWFDAHRQSLFPTLFMTSYYLYLRETRRSRAISAALAVLSSMLRFPYEVYTFWLGVLALIDWARLKAHRASGLAYPFSLIGASALLVAYNMGLLLPPPPRQQVAALVTSHVYQTATAFLRLNLSPSYLASLSRPVAVLLPVYVRPTTVAFSQLGIDVLTMVLLLLPVLFLPLLSWRWTPMLVPLMVLVFLSPYPGYHYPWFFRAQYPSVAIAAVFLGTVEGMATLTGLLGRRALRALAVSVLVVSALTAAIYEPYGPLNGHSGIIYDRGWLSYNITLYDDAMEALSLVPRNVSLTVAAQDNLPEVVPRPGGDATIAGCVPLQQADYLVGNVLHAVYFYESSDSGVCNMNMLQAAEEALSSGQFGLLAESGGTFVMERGYRGSVALYRPYSLYVSYRQLTPLSAFIAGKGYIIVTGNGSGPLFMAGGRSMLTLMPGAYRLSIEASASASQGELEVIVYGYTWNYTKVVLANVTLPASELTGHVTVGFIANNFYGLVKVEVIGINLTGSLFIRGLTLTQVAPQGG